MTTQKLDSLHIELIEELMNQFEVSDVNYGQDVLVRLGLLVVSHDNHKTNYELLWDKLAALKKEVQG